MRDVAVVIPTLRRPAMLERALRSVFAQVGSLDRIAAVVVADNDPEGSAAAVIDRLRPEAPVPLTYAHAPVPGVATARNVGLAAADAPLIAFLDDDEAASPGWLTALLQAQSQTGADVLFGPIRGRVPEGTGWTTAYLERFFGRDGPTESGLTDQIHGCGNSLMVRATALPGPAPFDAAMDQTGGEDDRLFTALQARGGRFGWAAEAWVDEFAPPDRATLNYALLRAFAYGQSPSQMAAARHDWPGLVRWMLIGAAQTAVWGLASLALTLLRRPARAETLDRMSRGLGKVFWTSCFEPKLYGAAMVRRTGA
ncbi:MAG: glycosyltransferase [Alphaproteobacteria bacterium]|uniref:glycosyltransferase family 2 protein n=1 Tax=Brevundimonas sp. TaxID=1871086 RepID=UPI001D8C6F90|nr:glycosyltransferase [Alphaproteobacteria bacterium]MBU1519961.1 glycosyltransferase [Alphaproteobacteria bacterium]MBU2031471.1 glycosyltransferase [Alphaproteobacteria bacterium]MBU2229904.1 glycosyltransferase [Alphaproteobacteria bacterium]MBU2401433.1 glycosyltransferase [Alphaproteobacteria bacterium]